MINTCQFVLCWVAHGHKSPPQPEEGPFGARLNLGTVTQISETKSANGKSPEVSGSEVVVCCRDGG